MRALLAAAVAVLVLALPAIGCGGNPPSRAHSTPVKRHGYPNEPPHY